MFSTVEPEMAEAHWGTHQGADMGAGRIGPGIAAKMRAGDAEPLRCDHARLLKRVDHGDQVAQQFRRAV